MALHRRFVFAASVAIIGAGLLAATPAASASQRGVAAAPGSSATNDETAAQTIDRLGKTTYTSIYGGVQLAGASRQATIYLTQHDAAAERTFTELAPTLRLTYRLTSSSAYRERQLDTRVAGDWAILQRHGKLELLSTGPDMATGREQFRVIDLTPAKRAFLVSRYGANIEVASAQKSQIPHAVGSRISDLAPWNGGDFISDGGGGCTSGIPTHNAAGQNFLVTAGHCFGSGATVYNAAPPIGLGSTSSSTRMGTIYSRDLRPGYLDAEILSTSASSLTWIGGTSTSTSRSFQGGSGPTQVGSSVCLSGAYEGEHCGLIVQPNEEDICLNITYDFGTQEQCHLTVAQGTDQQSVGSGDSGGPVYQYFGSTPKAVGIVTAAPSTAVCSNWDAQYAPLHNGAHRYCSNQLVFTNIANILQQWGLSVN